MSKFRIGISSDFLKADGSPSMPEFDRSPMERDPGVELEFVSAVDGEFTPEALEDLDALILLVPRIGGASFHSNGRLALVARFGVGYDSVDTQACTGAGVALTITPEGVRRPVAAAIMTMMLALSGKLLIKDRLTREGRWAEKTDHNGVGLVGKTLGSIGIGNIGADLFRLARPWDMNFIAHDPYVEAAAAEQLGVRLVDDIETLFRDADILCVNCPLSDATHHLVNAERLALMKPTAYLINTARGPIVDQAALTAALTEKRIAGAGIDVFESEPPDPDDPLLKLENVVVTPHALCWTDQCFAGIGAAAVASVFDVMHGREPSELVNRAVLENQAWRGKLADFAARFGA